MEEVDRVGVLLFCWKPQVETTSLRKEGQVAFSMQDLVTQVAENPNNKAWKVVIDCGPQSGTFLDRCSTTHAKALGQKPGDKNELLVLKEALRIVLEQVKADLATLGVVDDMEG